MSQVLMDTNSQIPMIGASGAIGGVLGAYLINYPNAKVLVLIPFVFFSQLIKIRAIYVLGFWFILQFINSFLCIPPVINKESNFILFAPIMSVRILSPIARIFSFFFMQKLYISGYGLPK